MCISFLISCTKIATKEAIKIKSIWGSIVAIYILLWTLPVGGTTGATGLENIDAQAYILIEQHTGEVLLEHRAHERMYPASTTKILTTLLLLEHAEPDDIITVGEEVNWISWDSSKAFHVPGEHIVVETLATALLLRSGNDSAMVAAAYIGRQVSDDVNIGARNAIAIFVDLMNTRARELGAYNSHFANPHGYHDTNHYTTAYDLAIIAQAAMQNPLFAQLVNMPYALIEGDTYEGSMIREYQLWNTNALLHQGSEPFYYPHATGIKTGTTTAAGRCLVSSAHKDGLELLAVVLNTSPEGRWLDSHTLLDYGFANYQWYAVSERDRLWKTVATAFHSPANTGFLNVKLADDFLKLLPWTALEHITTETTWYETLLASQPGEKVTLMTPLVEGQVVGEITFRLFEEVLFQTHILAAQDVERRTWQDVFFSTQIQPYRRGGIAVLVALTLLTIGKRQRYR